MIDQSLSIRPIQNSDISYVVDYWLNSDKDHLVGMGVDLEKLPAEKGLIEMLESQIKAPLNKKKSYALIWVLNNNPIGHCNVNQIKFGEQAYMHLHLWISNFRKKGMGTELVKKSIKHFFEILELKQLFCEPYSLNPAPNKTLDKLGFKFIKSHVTIPGSLNFEQEVNLWRITKNELKF